MGGLKFLGICHCFVRVRKRGDMERGDFNIVFEEEGITEAWNEIVIISACQK